MKYRIWIFNMHSQIHCWMMHNPCVQKWPFHLQWKNKTASRDVFPFHINKKKRPALEWSMVCSMKPDCPSVTAPPPLPPLPQDVGYSAERWNNAVAGLCLSCGWGNYCWDSHGSDRQTDSSVRGRAIKQPVRLTADSTSSCSPNL